MSNDIEALKLKLEMEKLKYQFRTTLAVSVIGPIVLAVLQIWIARQNAQETKTVAAEVKKVAVENAADIKQELSAVKVEQDQTLTTIKGGVEASVAGWKAYQTKEPEDMDRAAQAVFNAERLTENMPPATPRP